MNVTRQLVPIVLAALCLGTSAGFAQNRAAPQKVVFDTDFNTIGDDGQAFVMLAQAVVDGRIDLLGVTVVSGNQWLDQGLADALRAVERMGLSNLPVHAGAVNPLVHSQALLPLEQQLFGRGYSGAWRRARPTAEQLVAPPDGFAREVRPSSTDAVNALVQLVKANPGEVTILAVGPLTNVALAIRKNPEIVPLIKRVVYMGGAIDVPGNVTPAAEFNWWFDPEAARIVLREPIEHVIVPLDVTDKTRFGRDIYDRINAAATPVTRLFAAEYAKAFEAAPDSRQEIWDTITVAWLLDPTIATKTEERFVDVDVVFGPNYGRSVGHRRNPPAGVQKAKVILEIDQDRFWALFVDLLTRKVPAG